MSLYAWMCVVSKITFQLSYYSTAFTKVAYKQKVKIATKWTHFLHISVHALSILLLSYNKICSFNKSLYACSCVSVSVNILQLSNYSTNFHWDAMNIMPLVTTPASYFLTSAMCNTRWFKYDRDWFVCKQAALRSSCATLREWSHNLHPPSCSG